jgi:hypothetical protein
MNEAAKKWAGPAAVPTPEELCEHYALGRLAKIYALGIDLRDYDLCRSAFAPDAIGEVQGRMAPLDEYLKATHGVAASFASVQTMIGNQYIHVDGDEAEVWSYGIAAHKVAPGEARDEVIAGCIYRDRCRRFPQGWLITERRLTLQWLDMGPPKTPSQQRPAG